MKDLSPEMEAALDSGNVVMLTAVYIDINDTPEGKIRIHSGLGNFVIGGEVYSGVGELGSIDAITQDGSTSPNGISLTMAGLDPELITDVLTDGYQGREVRIMLCIFNGNDYTDIHSHNIYKGLLDTMAIQYGKTATITVKVENALINWFRSNTSRWNDETHQMTDPDNEGDAFFSLLQDMSNREIVWDPYIRRN